jgi:hypothetical protein
MRPKIFHATSAERATLRHGEERISVKGIRQVKGRAAAEETDPFAERDRARNPADESEGEGRDVNFAADDDIIPRSFQGAS